jgi:hypothetical protein
MITLQGSNPPPSPDEIAAFEGAIGLSLPPSYREFLKRNNGGMPPAEHCIWRDAERGLPVYVQYFFPLADTESNLLKESSTFPAELESYLLPICLEGSGSYLLLDLRTGAVLLWDADFGEIHPMTRSVDALLEACTAD